MQDLRQTANRVRVALCLGIEMFDLLLKALEEVKLKSTYLIEEVDKDLIKLEALELTIAIELESPNSALSRADVLEWVPGQRAKGMIIRQFNLMKKLGNTLGVKPNLDAIKDTANGMGFNLGDTNDSIFGQIQRS